MSENLWQLGNASSLLFEILKQYERYYMKIDKTTKERTIRRNTETFKQKGDYIHPKLLYSYIKAVK